jgi:hypothetical protein
MAQKFTLKRDVYRETRGGYARFLNIYCSACGTHVLLYQKDGPGVLYRLYLDRIVAPHEVATLQNVGDISRIPDLVCRSCRAVIGTPYIWEEESRPAYLLKDGSVFKKVGKGVYPPAKPRA